MERVLSAVEEQTLGVRWRTRQPIHQGVAGVEETAWKGIWENNEHLAILAAAQKEAKKWGIQQFGRAEEVAYFPLEDPPSPRPVLMVAPDK